MVLADARGRLTLEPVRRRPEGWALVRVAVESPAGSWEALDECLLRSEIRRLRRWLRDIARGRTPGELGFVEPNLRFVCVSADEEAQLRVWFEGELRPAWRPYTSYDQCDLWIDLAVDRAALLGAAAQLDEELAAIER
jgi:hypothetical protein